MNAKRDLNISLLTITIVVLSVVGSCTDTTPNGLGSNNSEILSVATISGSARPSNISANLTGLEETLQRQCEALQGAEICDIINGSSVSCCIQFLDQYEAELRDQAKLLKSFEALIEAEWQNLSDEERIELTASLEDLLREQSISIERFSRLLKKVWCLSSAKEKKKFLESYEDLLRRQSRLLLGFEDLLHRLQMEEDPVMAQFLASFEDLIRRQSVLLDEFSDFLRVNCHALKIKKSLKPLCCGCIRPGQEITYEYTVTNTENYTIEWVKIVDDRLGIVVEGASLAPHETRTFYKKVVVNEPPGTVICNTARVLGIDPAGFTIASESNRLCIRVASSVTNDDSITAGNQRALAISTDPAAASNTIDIQKNQKKRYISNGDTAEFEKIKLKDQYAGAINNARAANSIKIYSDQE
jgi:hypothetical protein